MLSKPKKKNEPRSQDYEGTQRVPRWDGERRGNCGDDEDERGNEGHVHRVIKSRRSMLGSMGSCEKMDWEVECFL